jgi:hypothetical protein
MGKVSTQTPRGLQQFLTPLTRLTRFFAKTLGRKNGGERSVTVRATPYNRNSPHQ